VCDLPGVPAPLGSLQVVLIPFPRPFFLFAIKKLFLPGTSLEVRSSLPPLPFALDLLGVILFFQRDYLSPPPTTTSWFRAMKATAIFAIE